MIERFLQYSKEHGKPVRLLIQNGKSAFDVRSINLIVLDITQDSITCIRNSKKAANPPFTVLKRDIIAADYIRGDHGSTLQYEPSLTGADDKS